MKRTSLALAVALSILLSPLSAPAQLGPKRRVQESSQAGNGLTWTIQMSPNLTVYDSIWVSSSLVNASRERFTFHTEAKTDMLEFILTPKGKEPVTRAVNASRPPRGTLQLQSGTYVPAPGQLLRSLRVDLRTLFNRLPAGEYSFQIRYPSSSYAIKGLAAYAPKELRSPAVRFEISDTSLAEAAKHCASQNAVRLLLEAPAKGKVVTTAKLANNTRAPIRFAAYLNFEGGREQGFKPPLATIMSYQRWHPKSAWSSGGFGFCGTGLGSYVLKAGASVTLTLNRPYESDGIYRYQLGYSHLGRSKQLTAYSRPVLIQTFTPEGDAAAK
ncbi:MAG: hypothetical protein ACE5F1_13725 [Planctomycetota bacterium]